MQGAGQADCPAAVLPLLLLRLPAVLLLAVVRLHW